MIIAERRPGPLATSWVSAPTFPTILQDAANKASSTWVCGRLRVISTLTVALLPDGSGSGPQWHVSVSRHGGRAKPHEVTRVLRDFDMTTAEEDNHHPGKARHFWMPVDPAHRVDCECKSDETVVLDTADNYAWSNTQEPGKCRGCEFMAISGQRCPIHGGGPVRVRR